MEGQIHDQCKNDVFQTRKPFKEFIIETNTPAVTSTGRVANDYVGDGTNTLKGCLADASADDKAKHSTMDHMVTHTIVQSGYPKAKRADG